MTRFILLFIVIVTPTVHPRLVLNHDFSRSVTPGVPMASYIIKLQLILSNLLACYIVHVNINMSEELYYIDNNFTSFKKTDRNFLS